MDFSGYHYYKFNHDILRFLGLWNLNAGWLEKFQRFLSITIFVIGIVVQVAAYFTNEYDLQMFARSIVFIVAVFLFLNKYLMFYANMDKMVTLLSRVEFDWNSVQNIDEYNILKKYTESGQFVLKLQILCTAPILFFFIVLQFLPNILDVVVPLNESRSYQSLVTVEFFFKETNYISVCVVSDIIVILGIITLIASETFILMLLEHTCAVFKLAGYRIQRAINEKDRNLIYMKLFDAVFMHQRAIEFAELVSKTILPSYTYLFAAGLASTIMNMYHLVQVILVTKDIKNFSEAVVFIIYQYFYIFTYHNMVQIVIDHSSDIFIQTYDTQWYRIPVASQKLVIFIIQRSMKSFTPTMCKTYIISRRSFSVVCNTLLSYLTFLCSTQK